MQKTLIAKKLDTESKDLALAMLKVVSSNVLINCHCFYL